MDRNEIKTLCLKHAYGAVLTDAEQTLIDEYTQTTDGFEYLQECREMKDLMSNIADVEIKPADHAAMVESFERTVRQSFEKTVFRPWWEANSPPMILGLLAGVFVANDGWNIATGTLLVCCVLWVITDCLQRYYYAKVLNRPDLYEYAKASRKRSDQLLNSLPGKLLVVAIAGLVIAAVSYVVYWGYQEFGLIVAAVVGFVVIEAAVIVAYQYRKFKRSDPVVWDWWTEEIKA